MQQSVKPLNIIFAGTPEFAAEALKALLASEHNVIAVYSQPDRPAGRGRKLQPSAVKALAQAHNVDVYQPASLRNSEAQQELNGLNADLMVVVAYGLILPIEVLQAPRLGCINIHGSLLPRWRGAAPIQRAIEAGDEQTGVTIMQMDEGLDTGDMLVKRACPIQATDTAQDLHDRLAALGGEAMLETIELLATGTAQPEPQEDALANYASKMSKAEAQLDWTKSAIELDRQIRAFNPWPICQTRLDDKVVRVWAATALAQTSEAAPGTVIAASKGGLDVATGRAVLRLTRLQFPGAKAVAVSDLINSRAELKTPGYCFSQPLIDAGN